MILTFSFLRGATPPSVLNTGYCHFESDDTDGALKIISLLYHYTSESKENTRLLITRHWTRFGFQPALEWQCKAHFTSLSPQTWSGIRYKLNTTLYKNPANIFIWLNVRTSISANTLSAFSSTYAYTSKPPARAACTPARLSSITTHSDGLKPICLAA